MSAVLFSSLAGRVIMGWLADLIDRKYVMILICCIVAAAITLLVLPPFEGKIYLFAIVFGIWFGRRLYDYSLDEVSFYIRTKKN